MVSYSSSTNLARPALADPRVNDNYSWSSVAFLRRPVAVISWLFVLSLLIRKTLLIRQRDLESASSVDDHALAEIAIVGASCFFLIMVPSTQKMLARIRGTSAMWMLGLYGLGAVSAVWSIMPAYSLFMAVEVISQILLIYLALSCCRSFAETEQCFLIIAVVVVLLGMGVTVRFHGLTTDLYWWRSNIYPTAACMLCCYCAAEYYTATGLRSRWLLGAGVFSFGAVVLASGAGSIISTLFGVSVAALVLGNKRWPMALLLSLVVAGAIASPEKSYEWVFRYKKRVQVVELHGRKNLWDEKLDFYRQRPIEGYGFATGAKLGEIVQTNTHNSALAVLLGMGAVGLAVAAATIIKLYREMWRSRLRFGFGTAGCICGISAGLLNSMNMSFLGEHWRSPSTIFFMLVGMHVLIMKNTSTSRDIPLQEMPAPPAERPEFV